MKTGFAKQLRVKLKVYSEMIGKNKLESIYDALSIAKSVRERSIDLKTLFGFVEKKESKYTIENRLIAGKQRLYNKAYYAKNAERILETRRELRLLKKGRAA